MFLHSKVKDQVIEENYQKTLTKKKYNMLSFTSHCFKADWDWNRGDGNRSRDSFPFIELLVIYDVNKEICCSFGLVGGAYGTGGVYRHVQR